MARRLPSPPPILPGFSYIRALGSGGFADVFLFEQNMPRRQVAVKVMLSEVVNDQVRQMFQAEANLMAQLSAHPSILTVYEASVSSDGRPYLVMELCSSSLSQRYRSERIPVAEVLRIAVKVGSALETAHRISVLHRDIKPSNILLTAYGHPVLSDFGIAATLTESREREAVGMSIPWSAPEVLMDDTAGTVASEVWAFSATVYSLLAGRSPFEIPGGANTSNDLVTRIGQAKVRPIERDDVPRSLERVLQRGMSRKAEDRQGSIIEFVHELQAIETELGLPQTAVEIAVDDWAAATVADFEDRTVIKAGSVARSSVSDRRRRRRGIDESFVSVGTMVKEEPLGQRGTGSVTGSPRHGSRRLVWAFIVAAVAAVVLSVVTALVLIRSNTTGIPAVSDIEAQTNSGVVEFMWKDPGLVSGDRYQVSTHDGAADVQQSTTDFVVSAEAGDRVCITVAVNREGKVGPSSPEKCVDVSQ